MMRDVWLLTKLHCTELLGWNRALRAPRGKERAKRIAALVAIHLAALLLCGYVGAFAYLLVRGLRMAGMGDVYPALTAAMVSLLTFIGALTRTSGTLYGCRDHDLQAALPVSRNALALSRVLRLYLYDGGFAILALVPMTIAWAVAARPSALAVALAFLLIPFLPLAPMALGAGVGLLFSGVARRTGGGNVAKTLALVALTLALLAGFYYGAWLLGNAVEEGGEEALVAILSGAISPVQAIVRRAPLAALYTAALNGPSVSAALGLVLIGVGTATVLLVLYAPRMEFFQRRILSTRRGRAVRWQERSAGVLAALWRKELRRMFSSPTIVLNTAFGYVLPVVAGAAIALKGNAVLDLLASTVPIDFGRFIAPGLALAFAFCVGTGNIAAASISLEGRAVWVSKTLPVPGSTILAAKALVPVSLGLPAVALGTALAAPALHISMPGVALIFLLPTGTLFLCAVFGLWLNLRSYRFDWTSETAVVKQSLPVGLAMLAPLAVALGGAGTLALGASLWWVTGAVWLAAILLGLAVGSAADQKILALKY